MSSSTLAPCGRLECVVGPMHSGKSTELIRRVKRALIARQTVQLFKPHLDDRYGREAICSHDGVCVAAEPIAGARALLARTRPDTQLVAIDEAQFFDAELPAVVAALADRGCTVLCVGLDLDYRGLMFPVMAELLAMAERVDKLTAVCVVCGADATRTQRLVDGAPAPIDGPTVLIGAQADGYESRCRRCHAVPGRSVLSAER